MAKFVQLMAVLLLGLLLFVGLLGMLNSQLVYLRVLEAEYVEIEAKNLVLLAENRELERLDKALVRREEGSIYGLDWETLRLLSYREFYMIADNESLAYLKEFE